MNPFKQKIDELQKLRKFTQKVYQDFPIDERFVMTCKYCNHITSTERFTKSLHICDRCGRYYPMPAMERLTSILDQNTFQELYGELKTENYLNFPSYEIKLKKLSDKLDISESVIVGTGKIHKKTVAIGIMDTRFLMGSMGSITGERITRLVEYATNQSLPLILFCASGGARMQEGILSLMQMAKTSAAIKQHHNKGLLYLSILTNPTTGGVTASFASLGDIILAEPKALIGFAGPRVIENTIKQKLPEGFQRSEYLEEHGFLDGIVPRKDLREKLSQLIQLHTL
ncbi:MAG: acetyl-CoA carboxylase, carboxyltransferase subunit beta [Eubacteriales bacterium]